MIATAPFMLTYPLVALLLGIGFGFVLESSGFGDSRKLAAQFYFTEMRVLKVMFTAIVTCMLLLVWTWSVGWLDFEAISVNPTYLWPGILGGVLLGFGFIIGGYCPGTSIVSAATLKVDGMFFVGGVAVGTAVFGETAGSFRTFYDTAGNLGRVTLPEWLGLSPGVVAVLIVMMAAFMFWGAEKLERIFGPKREEEAPKAAPRMLKPVMRLGALGLVIFATLILSSPAIGQPLVLTRLDRLKPELDETLESRSVHVDPVEVLGLMHSHIQGQRGRVQIELIDVRDETDYNLFHLVDARRATLDGLQGETGKRYAARRYDTAIKIVMGNDEARAERAYRLLRAQGAKNVYVLAGGVNLWLDLFRDGQVNAQPAAGDDSMRHEFAQALGERYESSRPSIQRFEGLREGKLRLFAYKVKPVVASPAPSAGCG